MRTGILILAAFSVLGVAAEDDKDKATFEAVCGSCHPTSTADGLRSEPEWKETIDEMVKIGAKGTPSQFDSVMRFLLRNQTKVNVNTATAQQIAPVLAISDAVARAIIARRSQIGAFKTIEELQKIPGVDAA